MPYCPKCDMEFVDGITICSDCGGPLVESKEVADAMKKKQKEEEMARKRAEFEAMQAAWAAEHTAELDEAAAGDALNDTPSPAHPYGGMADILEGKQAKTIQSMPRTRVYVKKSQQYEDLRSSASAFLLVGGTLTIFSILCWLNVIKLPMSGSSRLLTQGVMTAMGVGSLIAAVISTNSAKKVSGQVDAEEQATKDLINWFTENHTGVQLDAQIAGESGDLSPEELSLKRFSLIQDLLITNHDITDQSYIDMLSEEIYSKLYED